MEGKLPKKWKTAAVIPVWKPGKDPTQPSNYRPIALTSHVCKIIERIVNERLIYFLEKGGLISSYQSGFRRDRGTMDPIPCLENDNKEGSGGERSRGSGFL